MRYLAFVSLLLCFASCHKKIYQNRQVAVVAKALTAKDFRPAFEKALYRCEVDGKFIIKKFHLSGILYIRTLEDKSTRVVFQSEMGATLFDFGWDSKDVFIVHSIIDQMNKPALVKTLKKDFELLLAKNIPEKPAGHYSFGENRSLTYTRFDLAKGFVYYVTNGKEELTSIENANERQKVVIVDIAEHTPLKILPESLTIRHLKSNFTIKLKKIAPENVEE